MKKRVSKEDISKADISKAVGNIREDYILEAETYRLSETQKSNNIKISPAACFSIGLVACACLVMYLVFGGTNLIKMENGSESTAESVLKDDTQGSAHLTDSEQDAASNSSTEELESDTMNNAEVHIQGLILDGTDGDIASIIVEVDRKASEVDYRQVMFYLDENNKKWVDAVGSIVKITCGREFIEMAIPVGELISIEELTK